MLDHLQTLSDVPGVWGKWVVPVRKMSNKRRASVSYPRQMA